MADEWIWYSESGDTKHTNDVSLDSVTSFTGADEVKSRLAEAGVRLVAQVTDCTLACVSWMKAAY